MKLTHALATAAAAVCTLGGCAGSNSFAPATVVVATYNIRSAYGLDEKFDPDRTAAAISRLNAETVALNEVDFMAERSGNLTSPPC